MVQFVFKFHSDCSPAKGNSPLKMASRGSPYLFIFLLSLVCCSSSSSCSSAEKLGGNERMFRSARRALFDGFHFKVSRHDVVSPPFNYPATPVTNPVTTPSLVPPVVTVPATNPIGVTPNPVATPTPIPPAVPVPVPVPSSNPVAPAVPVTNPVTTPVTNPVTAPPVTNPTPSNAPATPGQSWCVAKSGIQDTALQSAIDYACGMGGADCSTIQQGGTCYNPNTLQNHASVAFNSYYQKNPSPTGCDFGGTAMVTNVNPSSGSCVFGTLSSSSTTTTAPGVPTPATASSSGAAPISFGTPPSVLNASNPASGTSSAGLGDGPLGSTSSTSTSNHFQPIIGCIISMITATITWIIFT